MNTSTYVEGLRVQKNAPSFYRYRFVIELKLINNLCIFLISTTYVMRHPMNRHYYTVVVVYFLLFFLSTDLFALSQTSILFHGHSSSLKNSMNNRMLGQNTDRIEDYYKNKIEALKKNATQFRNHYFNIKDSVEQRNFIKQGLIDLNPFIFHEACKLNEEKESNVEKKHVSITLDPFTLFNLENQFRSAVSDKSDKEKILFILQGLHHPYFPIN